MKAFLSILRSRGKTWWAPLMADKEQLVEQLIKHRLPRISHRKRSSHHPTIPIRVPKPCDQEQPKCRFIQYRRAHEQMKRLGMVSEDGSKMVELSNVTCASPSMLDFIRQRYCMKSLLHSVQYMKARDVDEVSPQLLPPLDAPGKIIGVDCNYRDNCYEQRIPIPREPAFYVKFASSIMGALDIIAAHSPGRRVDYGCQLAVVMGKRCREVSPKEALKNVFGYMVVQDIVSRDWNSLLGGRSMDTFLPLGPIIVHRCHVNDVNNLWIRTMVNGEVRQSGHTSNMIFKVDTLIHRLSHYMTLCPGDIILTGTPAGSAAYSDPSSFLQPGDLVETEIQNLGKMCNKIIEAHE
ncbi:hypothetical protein KR054_003915 [Drosophila jambulina]|nr:hypothetical protein KR054_003915 [Drosophila jambulina]